MVNLEMKQWYGRIRVEGPFLRPSSLGPRSERTSRPGLFLLEHQLRPRPLQESSNKRDGPIALADAHELFDVRDEAAGVAASKVIRGAGSANVTES